MATTAYGYIRVSSLGQVDKFGFDRQKEVIAEYANNNNCTIAKFYFEKGVSGTLNETDRPAFQDMVGDILKNGVDTVVIEGLDRLAREYRIQESLLIYLASKNIKLISARTDENITDAVQADPMKKALVQIQGVFSELEKNLLVKKLKQARDKAKIIYGKCEGAKRYGELCEVERAVKRRIRAMRRLHHQTGKPTMTYAAIADRLNSEGIGTKRGGKWSAAQVYQVWCVK